jgi:hypothetical protein
LEQGVCLEVIPAFYPIVVLAAGESVGAKAGDADIPCHILF